MILPITQVNKDRSSVATKLKMLIPAQTIKTTRSDKQSSTLATSHVHVHVYT